MTESQTLSAYFTYCKLQKNLDNKTLKAYLQYVKFLLLREKPSEEFKIYCEQNRFSNLVLHMLCQQELKLTVM